MVTAAQTIESRRAPRDIVSFRVLVLGPHASQGSVLMVDLSPFGFMARGAMPLAAGDEVTLRLPVIGLRRATVRWALGGRLGGEFADPIAAYSYAHLLARAPHDRPGWNEF